MGRNKAFGVSPIQVYGNKQGLRASQLKGLEKLIRRRLPAERLITQDFARSLTEVSHEIRRQVGVLVDRRGNVTHVMVGDQRSIEMPDWGRIRAGRGRLRGFRCIHTHLGPEGLDRDDVTDLALLRLDAMIAVEVDSHGLPGNAHVASLLPANDIGESVYKWDPRPPSRLTENFRDWIGSLEEELARSNQAETIGDTERALLVCVTAGRKREDFEASQAELLELAYSAGVSVVETVTQNRAKVDPRFVVGPGKLQDLVIRCFQSGVDLVIFDDNLTPTQVRNLAERLELRVIDRTQLILDIFAQRASSREGKVQVELAQLRYVLPRLSQRDTSLSRLAGGIGGRGPGETKLESDRRRVRDRITRLEKEIKKFSRERSGRRARRQKRNVPILSIVGYTNAGKSTLLRTLTQTDVHVEDKMFATLDTSSRRLRFPREREVIVTDTVGFIRNLPSDLVAAFKATLEELSEANLFLHVIDASSEDSDRRINAVRSVLSEIGLSKTPELLVWNKCDRLSEQEAKALADRTGGAAVSALSGTGMGELLRNAEDLLWVEDQAVHHRLASTQIVAGSRK